MTTLAELFASGRVVDLILAFLAIEAIALIGYAKRTGRGIAPASLFTNLLAGGFLLLSLRSALVAAAWMWTASFLAAALLAHLADLAQRWHR
jgi:hypothetical protein